MKKKYNTAFYVVLLILIASIIANIVKGNYSASVLFFGITVFYWRNADLKYKLYQERLKK